MNCRKAQMEILGLAIVVLLLILGMVFAIKFIAMSDSTSIRKEVSDSQMASNYISTYLATSTTSSECSGHSIKELLIDCAEGGAAPGAGNINCASGRKSCDEANEIAILIFSKTFDQWKTKYYFSAHKNNNPPDPPFIKLSYPTDDPSTPSVAELFTPCKGTKRSKEYPLSTSQGTLYITLDLCGLK